jgi:hypothetical protein
MAAAVTPFPTELTTPPVKKIYFVVILPSIHESPMVLRILVRLISSIIKAVGRAV